MQIVAGHAPNLRRPPEFHLVAEFYRHRDTTCRLVEGLSDEDMMLQSMPEASPVKWHLAHTTWFFETFLLQKFLPDYRPFSPDYQYLFNSYYESLGDRTPRHQRGLLSRPSLSEVLAYREYVDNAMMPLLESAPDEIHDLVMLGVHHEMQHQELILTDIKHALAQNPFAFENICAAGQLQASTPGEAAGFIAREGGLVQIGTPRSEPFAYDCEQPEHRVWLESYRIASRPVSNGEWLAFMEDGGYQQASCWLSDGWAHCQSAGWQAPLYWQQTSDGWRYITLSGLSDIDPAAPVCHISFYEADAFARWAGCRLPTEFEWEHMAAGQAVDGNFMESGCWHPLASHTAGLLQQVYGDVWEWTASSFLPYPGFSPGDDALGEYNGKFMSNQMVLRGGSCVTPQQQLRPGYRNFFHPHHRWQFSGLRLASQGRAGRILQSSSGD